MVIGDMTLYEDGFQPNETVTISLKRYQAMITEIDRLEGYRTMFETNARNLWAEVQNADTLDEYAKDRILHGEYKLTHAEQKVNRSDMVYEITLTMKIVPPAARGKAK